MGREGLGEFEHRVLLAILRLGSESYSVPIVLELEQRTAHLGEMLRGLLEEDLAIFRHVHGYCSAFSSTFWSVLITASGLKGFTMKSFAPAWSASVTRVS